MYNMLPAIVAVNLKMEMLLESDDSESSSSEDEITIILVHAKKKKRKMVPPIRIVNYFEHVIPNFTAQQFKMHFRLTPRMFEETVALLGPLMTQQSKGRRVGNVKQKLLAIIWLLATPDSFRSVRDRFNMSKGNLTDDFIRVIEALNNVAHTIITWPRDEEKDEIKREFRRFGELRDILGAIDGTYVPISAPKEHSEVYITRKAEYAMTLQCVAIPSLKFTDTFIGYPGSVSDTRIFRNSYIYRTIANNVDAYCRNSFIVGDKAYPILSWLIPPYIERRQLTPIQSFFNRKQAQTRQVIERSFGLLFGRFRRLKYLDMHRTDLIPATVNACCVIHNICIGHAEEDRDAYIRDGREFVIHNAQQAAIANENHQRQNYQIRDMLAQELYRNHNM